tara:strand:- start:7437 stop:7637 length:201 start_codon:yes stop_codon:yes gene_type:complete
MPQMAIKRHSASLVVYSFTTGPVYFRPKDWNIRSDVDALAYALYLERRGRPEEADAFLEQYLCNKG